MDAHTIKIPDSKEWITGIQEKARNNIIKYEGCTQSVLLPFLEEFGVEKDLLMRAAGGFFGGMVSSLTCGVHSAGIMIIGLLVGRTKLEDGIDGLFPMVMPAQELIKRLNRTIGSHSCRELTGVDFTDLEAAMNYRLSDDHLKCQGFVEAGAGEIARFLQELQRNGDLFRAG
jgi:hypothetical protein